MTIEEAVKIGVEEGKSQAQIAREQRVSRQYIQMVARKHALRRCDAPHKSRMEAAITKAEEWLRRHGGFPGDCAAETGVSMANVRIAMRRASVRKSMISREEYNKRQDALMMLRTTTKTFPEIAAAFGKDAQWVTKLAYRNGIEVSGHARQVLARRSEQSAQPSQ